MNEGELVTVSDAPMSLPPQSTALAIDFPPQHNRLTTFFRFIPGDPAVPLHLGVRDRPLVAVIIAWFALVITGRYPDGLYRFVSGFLRYYNARRFVTSLGGRRLPTLWRW